MALHYFHPAIQSWFEQHFERISPIQAAAWPRIAQGHHCLIAAPTGSGKTLAAFLAFIDQLAKEALAGSLQHETRVLYVSPLKALSNDIEKNLQIPLQGIQQQLAVKLTSAVRSGDTPQTDRQRMSRKPPHILVTTPESLYILLSSDSGRNLLSTVRSVIIDEIHALAGNKRGAHLSLSLQRLAALCPQPLTRIGLSATQKPIQSMAHFLMGNTQQDCAIIDLGHKRQWDLKLELPPSPMEAVMANEAWDELYNRLCELIEAHGTTLIFVNTRRHAERIAHRLGERLGEEFVTAHHGSLAKEHRLDAEQRLKAGQLKALVATASLELGIDIGDVDLVCQMGSPRSIAAFLQRVGRSGHHLGGIPKGRLFPLSRDELLEATALLHAIQNRELDKIHIPHAPLDVLAQQIVAEVANQEWEEEKLFTQFQQAWPYRQLTQEQFRQVVTMLAQGYSTRKGRRGAYLHHDAVNGKLRPRRAAKLTAVMNGGAIPDQFEYRVILQPQGLFIGTLNEDFAFESLPGDIFLLGNTSYRMLKIEQGRVFVEDAHGQPPNIPFWIGEAPGRSDELSFAVSRLRELIDNKLETQTPELQNWLHQLGLDASARDQLLEYCHAAKACLGQLPTQKNIVFERFFDETGDMHLVIHSPFGSRINRAWGLALRKRFCRKFNFELQAAALEDSIVLSLGPTHSFALSEVSRYLKSQTVENILTQALLTAPMFPTRWRWVCNIALAVPRFRSNGRVPAPIQRNLSEDLVAVVFPDQLACQENIVGDREIPDHPLIQQTLWDCKNELMDINGLINLLKGMESGEINVICKDLNAPSPFSKEIINARPYAFLDDTPAEERRTLAIGQYPEVSKENAASLANLRAEAIAQVRQEAWPLVRDADEQHDALMITGFMQGSEIEHEDLCFALLDEHRAARVQLPNNNILWVANERLEELTRALPTARLLDSIAVLAQNETHDPALCLTEIIRSRLECLGPVCAEELAASLALCADDIQGNLLQLEGEGFAVQGLFDPGSVEVQWCERGLLARMHRYSLQQRRKQVQPVSPAAFMNFLFEWQGIDDPRQGIDSLESVLRQLEGFSLPAIAWEKSILPCRLSDYLPTMLDQLCASGRISWLNRGKNESANKRTAKLTPISIIPRNSLSIWHGHNSIDLDELSGAAKSVYDCLQQQGALFYSDLQQETKLLSSQFEGALGELVANGLVTADSFSGLRALIQPKKRNKPYHGRRFLKPMAEDLDYSGRWSIPRQPQDSGSDERLFHIAHTLLLRYGVVFRKLLDREAGLPQWRDLLAVYRRLEARDQVRGGRFVEGFSGEQFALPEAAFSLRKYQKQDKQDLIAISAADPLNLTGIITPGARIPALHNRRIVYQNGAPIAYSSGKEIEYLTMQNTEQQWEIRQLLQKIIRRPHFIKDPANLQN